MLEMLLSWMFIAVGVVYLTYGSKSKDFWFLGAGIALVVFWYVVSGPIFTLIVGGLIAGAPFYIRSRKS